jgi:hypothetical protein
MPFAISIYGIAFLALFGFAGLINVLRKLFSRKR